MVQIFSTNSFILILLFNLFFLPKFVYFSGCSLDFSRYFVIIRRLSKQRNFICRWKCKISFCLKRTRKKRAILIYMTRLRLACESRSYFSARKLCFHSLVNVSYQTKIELKKESSDNKTKRKTNFGSFELKKYWMFFRLECFDESLLLYKILCQQMQTIFQLFLRCWTHTFRSQLKHKKRNIFLSKLFSSIIEIKCFTWLRSFSISTSLSCKRLFKFDFCLYNSSCA